MPEAGLLPGITQTINRAELTAALRAMQRAHHVVIFTDSMYVVRGCQRIAAFHKREIHHGGLADRIRFRTKRNSANHDLWHMVEDIYRIRGRCIQVR